MSTPHERLRKARKDAGFRSQESFANVFGLPVTTYRAHENGGRGITKSAAENYGKLLNVSPVWILFGEGEKGAPLTATSSDDNIKAADHVYKYMERHNVRWNAALFVRMLEEVKIALKTQPEMNDYVLGLIYKNAKATQPNQEETAKDQRGTNRR
jgi:transcriptional regulator with XRE-family HTH domain